MMRRNGIAIIIVLILVIWGIYDYTKNNTDQTKANNLQQTAENIGIKKGNKAPDFELLNLDEQPVKLSDFLGKKVILNFWATWCPPCRVEMPHMEKISNNHEEDVVVLSVNLTHTEKSQIGVDEFIEKLGLTFPVLLDTKGDVANQYQIIAYPTSYIIDSQGIIQEIFQGAINDDIMEKEISKIN
ncbi:peroxiredoxin family protein [Paenibacillus sp. FA6]|uniref:peroxiredoxin family protein n=1 Tax=Paenibacillus sp. FA6 TaxID=3413029 RepID=UPI003F65F5C7